MPELRVATSYARHLAERKRREEATDLLRPYLGLISETRGSVDADAAAELA
jgi:hypothetical protein